jgi:hypothetical protein
VTQPGYQAIFFSRVASSVTDNFGNRDNLRAAERRSKRKSESSLILWGRRNTQAMPIVSVTEVIEVIGYQLWRGVLWPYLAGHLGKYRSFNPKNWIRRHIRYRRLRPSPRPEQGYLSTLYIRDLNVQNRRFRTMPPLYRRLPCHKTLAELQRRAHSGPSFGRQSGS